MSDHKATPEQWQLQEDWAESDVTDSACLLELRDRLAAAEQRIQELISANEALRNRLSVLEEGYDEQAARLEAVETGKPCRLEGRANHPAKPNSSPTAEDSSAVNPPPAGGLVERALRRLPPGTDPAWARDVLLELSDWAAEQGLQRTGRKLREGAASVLTLTQLAVPSGGLAERVAWKIAKFASEGLPGDDATPTARAAILACADWLQQRSNTIDNGSGWAERLREEVGHA